MTFNLIAYNLHGITIASAKQLAELTMQDARTIVDGGAPMAREYALASYEKFPTSYWEKANNVERERMVKTSTRNALNCAHNIIERGEAWFIQGDLLAVASLSADASAGPVGYLPLLNISDHKGE